MRTRLPLVATVSVLGFVLLVAFFNPPTSSANWQSQKMPSMENRTSACPFSPQTPVDWDPRLGDGAQVLPLLDKVKLHSAIIASGQAYWRVVKVKFEDFTESHGNHDIYVRILGENCNVIYGTALAWWGKDTGPLPPESEKPPGDVCDCNYNLPMFGDSYGVKLLGLPSDSVDGMILPMHRHVNYLITYQRTTNVALVPSEVPEADTLLLMSGGLGGLATWVAWQKRRSAAGKKSP